MHVPASGECLGCSKLRMPALSQMQGRPRRRSHCFHAHLTWEQVPRRELQTWKPAWRLRPWQHPPSLCQLTAAGSVRAVLYPGQQLLPLMLPGLEPGLDLRLPGGPVVPADS